MRCRKMVFVEIHESSAEIFEDVEDALAEICLQVRLHAEGLLANIVQETGAVLRAFECGDAKQCEESAKLCERAELIIADEMNPNPAAAPREAALTEG